MQKLINWFRRLIEKTHPPRMDDFVARRYLEITANGRKLSADEKELFEMIHPGESRVPCIDYQIRIEKLFQLLANDRETKWKESPKDQKKKYYLKHALAELNCLRDEIVDLKTQITNSERWLAGWFIGCVFAYSKDLIPHLWILTLPFFIWIYSFS